MLDDHLLGWTPVAHYRGFKKFLKRVIYGRRYSKPADRLFQDYYWGAWAEKNKPVGGALQRISAGATITCEYGPNVVIPKRDWSINIEDKHAVKCKTCDINTECPHTQVWYRCTRNTKVGWGFPRWSPEGTTGEGAPCNTCYYGAHTPDVFAEINDNIRFCNNCWCSDHWGNYKEKQKNPQAVLTFDSSVSQEEIAGITKKLKDPKTRVKYNNPAGGVWLPAGTSYHVLQELNK